VPFVTTPDGVEIFYKDWGSGQPGVFCHRWPLNSDSWESQQLHLASNGCRAIAHDRRGHGRSTQVWDGNDMDHYADDLAALLEALDLRDVVLIGFSTGGGEVARYIGRHGTGRVAKAVLVSAVPPFMLQTEDNPGGVPIDVFDGLRTGSLADRSQLYRDLADGPFFGNNRDGVEIARGPRDSFWRQGMQAGHKNAYDSIAAFSATDMRPDLDSVDVPTLVIHGDDDQIVPIAATGLRSAKMIKGATLRVYKGAPHGLMATHKEQFHADLLQFAKEGGRAAETTTRSRLPETRTSETSPSTA
jgi:non-heme chloroperoxidase